MKADVGNYITTDAIAIAGSGFSVIKRLTANLHGLFLNDNQDMNYAVNLRNLLKLSKP